MIEEVKNTKWYTPGILNEYEREMNVVRDKNKEIDSKFNVDDEKVDKLLNEVPVGMN
jgi:small nuclear ribonucleoprotein (snRNP)-like protein